MKAPIRVCRLSCALRREEGRTVSFFAIGYCAAHWPRRELLAALNGSESGNLCDQPPEMVAMFDTHRVDTNT